MKKRLLRLLCGTLACAMLLPLTACDKGDKDTESNGVSRVIYMGAENEIPCLELVDSTCATVDKVEWTFEEMGRQNGYGFGIAKENVTEPMADFINWDFGDDVYQNKYIKVKPNQYETLVTEMTNAGYKIYSEGNLNGDVSYTLLTYQDNVYSVTYCLMNSTMYVTASASRPLSPLLFEDNYSTQAPVIDGMETTLTMLTTTDGGDCYVIQLKNGHYILFDGGSVKTFANTLDYLVEHAPEGQTPVVDAWFITHGHYDHIGWTAAYYRTAEQLAGILGQGEAAEKLRVNGVYFSQTENAIIDNTVYSWRSDTPTTGYRNKTSNDWPYYVDVAATYMKTEDGSQTQVYRPQTGHTYYFCGLTVEVPYTQEHITFSEYQMDLNASSTWYLIRAEGKTFLDAGDTENVNIAQVVTMYSSDYSIFNGQLDIMSAFHHGHNIYSDYIDTLWAPQMFYTCGTMFQWASEYTEANRNMLANHNITYYCYGDGAYQYSFTTGKVTKLS